MLTDEAQQQYAKLKQIDEYAKSLGFTIYKIVADFKIGDKVYCLSDTSLNVRKQNLTPERQKEFSELHYKLLEQALLEFKKHNFAPAPLSLTFKEVIDLSMQE